MIWGFQFLVGLPLFGKSLFHSPIVILFKLGLASSVFHLLHRYAPGAGVLPFQPFSLKFCTVSFDWLVPVQKFYSV